MNQPGEEKGHWDLLNVHKYVMEGNEEDGARVSSVKTTQAASSTD